VPSVGAINARNYDSALAGNSPTVGPVWSTTAALWSTTMTAPHYISENKSDMRGIKPGWYAIEDDGNLSSGPFSSPEECVQRINQPTNAMMKSKLQRGPH
jgi:hypothetical protein